MVMSLPAYQYNKELCDRLVLLLHQVNGWDGIDLACKLRFFFEMPLMASAIYSLSININWRLSC